MWNEANEIKFVISGTKLQIWKLLFSLFVHFSDWFFSLLRQVNNSTGELHVIPLIRPLRTFFFRLLQINVKEDCCKSPTNPIKLPLMSAWTLDELPALFLFRKITQKFNKSSVRFSGNANIVFTGTMKQLLSFNFISFIVKLSVFLLQLKLFTNFDLFYIGKCTQKEIFFLEAISIEL